MSVPHLEEKWTNLRKLTLASPTSPDGWPDAQQWVEERHDQPRRVALTGR
jgi:hypothetical protein